jgi:hypothetical protein
MELIRLEWSVRQPIDYSRGSDRNAKYVFFRTEIKECTQSETLQTPNLSILVWIHQCPEFDFRMSHPGKISSLREDVLLEVTNWDENENCYDLDKLYCGKSSMNSPPAMLGTATAIGSLFPLVKRSLQKQNKFGQLGALNDLGKEPFIRVSDKPVSQPSAKGNFELAG